MSLIVFLQLSVLFSTYLNSVAQKPQQTKAKIHQAIILLEKIIFDWNGFRKKWRKCWWGFGSPCGSGKERIVVIVIVNRILLPWDGSLWLSNLFGNIHSYQSHHPEKWENRLKRGRTTWDALLSQPMQTKLVGSFSIAPLYTPALAPLK